MALYLPSSRLGYPLLPVSIEVTVLALVGFSRVSWPPIFKLVDEYCPFTPSPETFLIAVKRVAPKDSCTVASAAKFYRLESAA